jgi:hypothetical protein
MASGILASGPVAFGSYGQMAARDSFATSRPRWDGQGVEFPGFDAPYEFANRITVGSTPRRTLRAGVGAAGS